MNLNPKQYFFKEYTTEADLKNKTRIMISKNILIRCAFPLHLNKCATHMINAKKTSFSISLIRYESLLPVFLILL